MQQRKAYERVALELPSQNNYTGPLELENLQEEQIVRDRVDNNNNINTVAAVAVAVDVAASFLQTQHQTLSKKLSIAFWIAGLLNNAGYVIMIASAKSISEGGVGLVFLANILPALVVKTSAPYWFEKVAYQTRLTAATILMILSFGIVAGSGHLEWQLFGVACTSAQGSLGEASLLALAGKIDGELCDLLASSQKQKGPCLNGFSSGTGFAGVFGFFWVWIFNSQLQLSLSITLWLAMILAGGYLYSYTIITHLSLEKEGIRQLAESQQTTTSGYSDNNNENENENDNNDDTNDISYRDDDDDDDDDDDELNGEYGTHEPPETFHDEHGTAVVGMQHHSINAKTESESFVPEIASLSNQQRLQLVLSLWPYTIPLFTVYVSEYTLQSGTWTAIGFPVSNQESRDTFYEYSNWMYQVGVFISRSSGVWGVAPITLLWIMPILQCLNVIIYWSIGASQTTDTTTTTTTIGQDLWHSPYFLYPTALYSGLLGGAVYIHGYLRICRDLPLKHREFALSATSMAECLGIVVADLFGLLIQACLYQIHNLEGAALSCPTTKS